MQHIPSTPTAFVQSWGTQKAASLLWSWDQNRATYTLQAAVLQPGHLGHPIQQTRKVLEVSVPYLGKQQCGDDGKSLCEISMQAPEIWSRAMPPVVEITKSLRNSSSHVTGLWQKQKTWLWSKRQWSCIWKCSLQVDSNEACQVKVRCTQQQSIPRWKWDIGIELKQYWLDQRVCSSFSEHLMEKPKQIFFGKPSFFLSLPQDLIFLLEWESGSLLEIKL